MKNSVLSLTIKDKSALYAAYMPFLENGGLFIPTKKLFSLGDEVFMLLTLTDSKEKLVSCALLAVNELRGISVGLMPTRSTRSKAS